MGLGGAKHVGALLETNVKLTSTEYDSSVKNNEATEDKSLTDAGTYQRLVSRLLYLTMTRVGIAFVVQLKDQTNYKLSVTQTEEDVYKVGELTWLTGLFKELEVTVWWPIDLYYDSKIHDEEFVCVLRSLHDPQYSDSSRISFKEHSFQFRSSKLLQHIKTNKITHVSIKKRLFGLGYRDQLQQLLPIIKDFPIHELEEEIRAAVNEEEEAIASSLSVKNAAQEIQSIKNKLSAAKMQNISMIGEQDMLDAAKLQNELNRTNMFAKILEAGPKAAKDLIE
uniref:Uncharacterized protein LOC104243927 n=1 Tax=Nicotiana sylvestris TaxID=4096 RepID=A0A1U7XZX2_NICSY|nr:PREDICTED: uncharacterized protein LOC104243927 [Nicotiana sylvestris]